MNSKKTNRLVTVLNNWILMIENGYIVKKLNNKNVYLDNNFRHIDTCKVIGTDFEYISGMDDDKYKGNYYNGLTGDELTENEYKEFLCSLDYDFINTDLYEKYYR